MTNIDSLSISISAESEKASKSLDKLIGQLNKVSVTLGQANTTGLAGLSSGVTQLTSAMTAFSQANVGGGFTKLAHNLQKITAVNSSGLDATANALRNMSRSLNTIGTVSANAERVVEIANGIGKLGGAKVERAIANMPALATALSNLMSTLSQAPTVSRNLIAMTNALAGLAAQSAGVNSMANNAKRNMSQMGSQIKSSSGLFTRLASVIGKVYASYFLLIRGTKAVWKAIESAMDYGEVLNYFESAFNQVADKADLTGFKDLGYKSADEYYKSFSERAKEYNTQMTGFTSDASGMLKSTGGISLGLNPTQVMNTQALFGQLSSSMGVASEEALKLSRVYTELGADLASIKNEDFAQVWSNLSSGLVGMPRALDKFGVNIREANLQQKLYSLGINATVDSLGQQDKALLRTIILLESTKFAWGDMANTLNSPANQLRLLQSNFTMLSQTLGTIFIPVVTSILPYIRALTISLTHVLEKIREFLGITGIDWGNSSASADNLSDIYDALADDIGNASDKAAEFQRQLMGFDEINKLEDKKDKGSATGVTNGLISDAFNKAYEEYQRAWNESYAKVDDKAQKLAEVFDKAFSKVAEFFTPISKSISRFAKSLVRLGKARAPLDEGFMKGLTDALDFLINEVGVGLIDSLSDGIDKFSEVLENTDEQTLKDIGEALSTLATAFLLYKTGSATMKAIENLRFNIDELKKVGTIAIVITVAIEGWQAGHSLGMYLFPDQEEFYDNFHWFGEDGFFTTISEDWGTTFSAMGTTFGDFTDAIGEKLDENGFKFGDWWVNDVEPFFKRHRWLELLIAPLAGLQGGWEDIKEWWDTKTLSQVWDDYIAPYFTYSKWFDLLADAFDGMSKKWDDVKEWWKNSAFKKIWDDYIAPYFTFAKWAGLIADALNGLQDGWKKVKEWWSTSTMSKVWDEDIAPFFSKDKWTLSGIKEGLEQSFKNAVSGMKTIWNNFADDINKKTKLDVPATKVLGKTITPAMTISLGQLPKFANGGFMEEDGLFFANHNELLGQFSNGKTAIANNYQIEQGIENAVYRAMMSANAGNSGKTVVESNLYLDGTLVAKSVNQANARQDRRFNTIATT